MTRNTTFALVTGLLCLASALAGGCGWSNAHARGVHLWKQDHATYRYRNFPFVPSNAVGQCPAPGDCPTEFVEPPFFGYHDTCWRRWPEGWTPCPVEPESKEATEDSGVPAPAQPSTSDRPRDEKASPDAGSKQDSVIVPAKPERDTEKPAAPASKPQAAKEKTKPAPKTNAVPEKTAEPKKEAPAPKPEKKAEKAPPSPTLPMPPLPPEQATPKKSPAPATPKPKTSDGASRLPRTPTFFPGHSRHVPSDTVPTLGHSQSAKSQRREPQPVAGVEPVALPVDSRLTRLPESRRLKRSLRDRLRVARRPQNQPGADAGRTAQVTRVTESRQTPSSFQVGGPLETLRRQPTVKARRLDVPAVPVSLRTNQTSKPAESATGRPTPRAIPAGVKARPIPVSSASSVGPSSTTDSSPAVVIDAQKLREATK